MFRLDYMFPSDIKNSVDLLNLTDKPVERFTPDTLTCAYKLIRKCMVPGHIPIAYRDPENPGKLILVKSSDVFDYVLAHFFPQEFGIQDVSLLNFAAFGEVAVGASGADLMGCITRYGESHLSFEAAGASADDLELLADIVDSYKRYKMPIQVYENREDALFVSGLV